MSVLLALGATVGDGIIAVAGCVVICFTMWVLNRPRGD